MNENDISKILGENWKIKTSSITKQDMIDIKLNDKKLSSCTGKAKHKTLTHAMVECKIGSDYLEPYKCSFCGFYHVGKNKETHKVTRKRN